MPAPEQIVIPAAKLIAYSCVGATAVAPTSGQKRRDWMDKTANRFAYRCLPMVIANQLGWDIINPQDLSVYWTGNDHSQSLVLNPQQGHPCAVSHFGHGILSFTIQFLFQTPPDVNLLVKGPPNCPKDGIYPLEGVVETDQAASTFTMNWMLTRSNRLVKFQAGEPICRIVPIPRYLSEILVPEMRDITSNQELFQQYSAWQKSRDKFNQDLVRNEPEAVKQEWQRDYFKAGVQNKLVQGEFHDATAPASDEGQVHGLQPGPAGGNDSTAQDRTARGPQSAPRQAATHECHDQAAGGPHGCPAGRSRDS